MRQVASLYLPTWPTDRLRRSLGAAAPPPDIPLVVIGREGTKRIVVGVDSEAHSRGIAVGMAVSMAKALEAGLVTLDADNAADTAALERLAIWVLRRYSPIVAIDPPDGLMIDMSGAAHLVGGEDPATGSQRWFVHGIFA